MTEIIGANLHRGPGELRSAETSSGPGNPALGDIDAWRFEVPAEAGGYFTGCEDLLPKRQVYSLPESEDKP